MTTNAPTSVPKADILIVDDTLENLRLLSQILSQNYKVRVAPSGTIGLAAARAAPPDLILLDIMMPAMNGYEFAAQAKSDPATSDIPIIFMSALDDIESKVRGFQAGGIDYVTKPFQEVEVLARVRTHLSIRNLYKQAQAEILERRRVENELRDSSARMQALLSAVPDTMYRISRDGEIIDFNANNESMLFAPQNLVKGAYLANILEKNLASKISNCIHEVLDNHQTQTLEYSLSAGSIEKIYEARLKDSGPNEVTMMVRDISERARLEQMKSDFINRATHELRTPITTMLLMVKLIDKKPDPDQFDQYWDVLKGEIQREHMLVEKLLTVGRLESGRANLHFSPILLGKLLNEVAAGFDIQARDKEVSLSLQISGNGSNDLVVYGDENALTQVFVNLVSNAIKFTTPGGEVKISAQGDSHHVYTAVSDNGIGIPSADVPLLFTRFFRGSNAVESEIPGTGVGLYIVQSIVEQHGGEIKVHSEVGKGSQFEVLLPVQPGD